MAIDFPASPSNGQTFTDGSTTWTWDGTKWSITSGAAGATDKIEEGNTSAEVIDTGSDGRFVVTTEGSERLRVDKSGRLLVGTSSALSGSVNPNFNSSDALLQVVGNSSGTPRGATFALGRSQAASAISANDFIGGLIFSDNASAEFAHIFCYADAAAGTGDHPSRLVFSTTADGASSPTERMRIGKDGETALFHNNYGVSFRTAASSGNSIEIIYCTRNATNVTNGTGVFAVYTNGTYATLSDQTQKKNIETTRDGYLDDLNKLRVVKYNWNEQEDNEPKELGLIAQEVEQVFPGLINEMRSEEGELPKKGVKAGVLPYMLIKALQEATARIETLEAKVAALEGA